MKKVDKILVCGNGPSLIDDLKGADLSDYFVIRINDWKPLKGYDNKIDAWFFDMFAKNYRIGVERLKNADCQLWPNRASIAQRTEERIGRKMDYVLPDKEFDKILDEYDRARPRNGPRCVHIALLFSDDVYIAGFDHYEGKKHYYHKDAKNPVDNNLHKAAQDKAFIDRRLKAGLIKLFNKRGE